MTDLISPDDILTDYMCATEDKKHAISSIIKCKSHLVVTNIDDGQVMDVETNFASEVFIAAVIGLLKVGKKVYGEAWVETLKKLIRRGV